MSVDQENLLTAGIAGVVALAVAGLTAYITHRSQMSKLRHELRTEFMVEQAIVGFLSHKTWNWRSFEVIEKHLGGFQPDELRRHLVRAGALRFYDKDGKEHWGLRQRNLHLLGDA